MWAPSTMLPWLPVPPASFAAACRSLFDHPDPLGDRIQILASTALNENQLVRLSEAIGRARRENRSLAPLSLFRIGVISNSTPDFMISALIASAARHGLALECVAGGYDQAVQDSVNPDSTINRARPDAVLIALDWRAFDLHVTPGDSAAADACIQQALDHLQRIRKGIRQNCGSVCILQTLAPPPERLFGSLDRSLPGTRRSLIDRINQGIAHAANDSSTLLFDVAAVAETVGLANWHSPKEWNLAKLPFSQDNLALYAEHGVRLLAALRGKSRRCLVLDLDNTIWGGVIGDDGLNGIRIAQGDASGEGYLELQRYALALRDRGVVLAVCSKNEDSVARLPFKEHPEMLLREGHFAVFQANWEDKAANIQAIARELSLGLDAIVFVDDNPFERELVRERLPNVAVPEMPEDAALFSRTLSAAGYFEAVSFSREDAERASYYEDNARRAELEKQAGDLDEYLASLRMEIAFHPFDEPGRARIAQLINKSNQFNLATRRYTEVEVQEIETDPSCFAMQVRLSDRFGDNGMISVVICRPFSNDAWEIDTWLMSCRVLGRRVEQTVLREILEQGRRRGVRKIIGVYRPTGRNKLVEDHYAKLGFSQRDTQLDNVTVWEMDISAQIEPGPMKVQSTFC